jgi:hypothetical protein
MGQLLPSFPLELNFHCPLSHTPAVELVHFSEPFVDRVYNLSLCRGPVNVSRLFGYSVILWVREIRAGVGVEVHYGKALVTEGPVLPRRGKHGNPGGELSVVKTNMAGNGNPVLMWYEPAVYGDSKLSPQGKAVGRPKGMFAEDIDGPIPPVVNLDNTVGSALPGR